MEDASAANASAQSDAAFTIRIPQRPALLVLVLLLGTTWGFQYTTAKLIGIGEVDSAGALFAVHIILSFVFVSTLLLMRRTFLPSMGEMAFYTAVALFNNIIPLGAELFAARHVSAGELALIISLTPVCVLFFTFLLQSEVISARRLAGILLGCVAGSTILLPEAMSGGGDGLGWVIVAFAGPVSGGLGVVLMAKHWPKGRTPMQVACGNLLAGTAILLPVMLLRDAPMVINPEAGNGGWAVLAFALTVGVEFYLLALITRLSGAAFASCSDFIAICAGLGWSYVFFAEVPTGWMLASAGFCFAALKMAADSFTVRREAAA